MTRINTNVSSLVAQKTLNRSNAQLQESLTRLSTGLRINVGKDDPAGLIASEVLRSDIVSVNKAITNSERANQLIATADSALNQVSSLLNDIRGLVSESANTGALSDDQISANQLQVDSSLEAIDRIAQTTVFQGRRLLDGGLDFLTSSLQGFASGTVGNTAALKASGTIGDLDGVQATGLIGTAGTNSFTLTADAGGSAYNGVTVTYVNTVTAGNETATYNATTKVITVGIATTVTTVAQVRTAINNQLGGLFTATATADAAAVATGAAAGTTANGNDGNQITLVAKNAGTAANGAVQVTVGAVDKGAETVAYAAGTLTVTVNAASTANDIAAAINRATGSNSVYTATVNGAGTGTYATTTFTGALTGGALGSQFTLTALNSGPTYDGVDVAFVTNGGLGAGTATVAYNSVNKLLTVQHNAANVNAVISAINTDATVGTLFRATALDAGTAAVTSTTDNTNDATTGGALGSENITDLRIDQANFGTANTINVSVNVDAQATKGTLTYTGGSLTSELVLEVGGKNGFEVFNFGIGSTISQIATAINTVKDATGLEASVSGNSLTLNSTDYGSKSFVSARVLSGSFNTTDSSGATSNRAAGTDVELRVNGIKATGDGLHASLNTSTLDLSFSVGESLAAGDTVLYTITGGGANFQLGPDVVSNQQARLGIQGVSTATLGGISGTLFELRSGGAKSLAADVKGAAAVVDEVISAVTRLRGRLGAFQKTTLETNIGTLNDTLTNLTDAESSIRDADFAAESARLTRAQILVQSGTQVLQIANQNPQNVLALLRN